jgi:imidazolonepropionase-like amidohydrolase
VTCLMTEKSRWEVIPVSLGLVLSLACHSTGTAGRGNASGDETPSLTLQHGTLINPGARPIPEANVVIRGGRIACAGTATACPRPAGSKAIDLNAGYVGPGLVDAHVHYGQTGWVDGRPDALDLRAQYPYDSVRRALETHPERFHQADLCSGVTSVFDVGGFDWTYDLARKTRGATDVPRVVATGPLLATITVDPDLQDQMVFMKDEATTRAAVRSHRARGAEAIKVWYIEVPDSLRPHAKAMLLAAADETRKAGLRLVVHATELHSAKDALEAGAAVLVHEVFSDTVDAAFVAAARRAGTIVIPTLSVLDGYTDVFLGRSPAKRYPLDCVDPATRRKVETILPDTLRARRAAFWGGPGAALRSTAAGNLERMYTAGIPIAMGTDAGNPGTAHGPSVYGEMEAMQHAGMPAKAVFASATIVAARAMALDKEVGSVEPGKRADLVVFDADPTTDIANARQVRFVVHNGVLYSRQDLLPR